MRRIKSQGTEHGQQITIEVTENPLRLTIIPLGPPYEADILSGQRRDQHVIQYPVLILDKLMGGTSDLRQCFPRRQVVRARLGRAECDLLLDAGDPNLKELVQIRAGDTQKSQTLQKRNGVVHGEIQYPVVKRKQAQLAIRVEFWLFELNTVQYDSPQGHEIGPPPKT